MDFKCKHCEEQFDNPEIYRIHEYNCLENQKLNGILKEIKLEDMKVQDLKELAKEKGIEGYADLKKEELINALKAVE